ncbi:MAG: acetyl-CoA carboxylase biotin carboxyl carrier protein [Candidatus Omnitrophota bacterium]|nr:acetyl-CoA carboxylase biotin carboxyl carrier protein [Candidatus Omnitrophota bacterium]
MNLKEIKEMINLMNENNLMELEIEREGMRIKLKRSSGEPSQMRGPVEYKIEMPQISQQSAAAARELAAKESSGNTVEIKSPMVGTFYRAPSPEAGSFVEVGQEIEIGQVICIIEAMKLMNEIKSEVKGRIVEVLVENAEPVEFGQPLFLIES